MARNLIIGGSAGEPAQVSDDDLGQTTADMLASALADNAPKISWGYARSGDVEGETTAGSIIADIQSGSWKSEVAAVREASAFLESIRQTASDEERKTAEVRPVNDNYSSLSATIKNH